MRVERDVYERVAERVQAAGRDDVQAGYRKEEPLHRLTVCGTVAATSAHWRTNDDGTARLIVVHLPEFRGVVDDLIGAQCDEIAEHDFDNRAQTAQRHPARESDYRAFADRRRQHAVGEARAQPGGNFECAAVRIKQVLADQIHVGMIFKKRVQGLIQNLRATNRLIAHRHYQLTLSAVSFRGAERREISLER